MVSQADIEQTLAFMLGENNTPTGSIQTQRRVFIQRTLEEIYRAYPWSFAGVTATLSIANGVATLPTSLDDQHKVYAYFDNGGVQTETKEVNFADQDMFVDGKYKFWIEHISNGVYKLVTKDTSYSTVVIRYQTQAPTLDASTNCPFRDISTIALGARRYVKIGENPDADISQDEALFQKRLTENTRAAQVNRPLRKRRSAYEANNYRIGEN